MLHNLFSPTGHPLTYPHTPKWDERNNIVGVVTNPKNKVQKGDIIFTAIESKTADGEMVYSYFIKPHTVVDVLEERKAKGQHQVDFIPVFQSLSVELIKE